MSNEDTARRQVCEDTTLRQLHALRSQAIALIAGVDVLIAQSQPKKSEPETTREAWMVQDEAERGVTPQ